MHELSLCRAIADAVTPHADGREVSTVTVRVGHFRQVVPDTLRFCWEMQVADSPLAGSELRVVEVPAVARCRSCGASTVLDVPVVVCGTCGSADAELTSGEEFLVESIDVASVGARSGPEAR